MELVPYTMPVLCDWNLCAMQALCEAQPYAV